MADKFKYNEVKQNEASKFEETLKGPAVRVKVQDDTRPADAYSDTEVNAQMLCLLEQIRDGIELNNNLLKIILS